MRKVKSVVVLLIILAVVIIMPGRVCAGENNFSPFDDVPENHWAYKPVHELRLLGITEGVGNNCFGMGLTITRSEFVTLLVRLMEWELLNPEKGSFEDNMDPANWYYSPIETALHHGVISHDNVFRVDDPITREEMAIMIVRTLGYDSLSQQLTYLGNSFDDVTQNIGYINIARDFGIIYGVGDNLFQPYNTAKREEAAAMMMRMYEKIRRPIKGLHGFYAIHSATQLDMIPSFNSVGFGWSRLEYDGQSKQVVLNTTRKNNNEFAIPEGFTQPINIARANNVSIQLMVYASNNTVVSTETGAVPLIEYIIVNPEIRDQVINLIVKQVNSTKSENTTVSFDGVVIDFEDMKGEQLREPYNTFLAALKQELEKTGSLLYVAVHPPQRPGQSYYDGYDFKTIGEIADRVILMAHDYYAKQLTDDEMQMGYTITPLSPIYEVYYALRSITCPDTGIQDLDKILLQVSFDSVQ